ncbi:outer membrane protein [Paludibacterium paludis]|uniref:Outer membrane protein n=2 Tax=Paludibacterium paludis TaxID=1225769 RepID=A0A918NZS2_9NEIS|nr:outer membrane protein [Paludibacterium paludis]
MIWLAIAALPGQATAFDLIEAWQAARNYDAGYAASRADLAAGQERQAQGRAGLLPQVSVTGNYTRANPIAPKGQDQNGRDLRNGAESHGYTLGMTQPLFDVSRYTGYQKGKIDTALSQTQYEQAEQQLISDVAKAYFDVLLAQDSLSATQAAKKSYKSQLDQAKTSFEVGTATITDTYEAQAGYDGAIAEEIIAQSTLEIAINNLTRLTGLPGSGIQPLASRMVLDKPDPETLDGWVAQALNNSLEIRAQTQQVARAEQDLTEKRGSHLPTVNLTANYQDNRSNQPAALGGGPTRGSSIGVNISLPLFAGGGINAQVREAAARLDSAREKLEATRRKVREDVRRAYLGVTNGAAYVRAQEQLLVSAKSKLESTRLGKEVGVRTNLDLLKAEQDYTTTIKTLADARYRYLNARIALAQSVGRLDEGVLRGVNASIRH